MALVLVLLASGCSESTSFTTVGTESGEWPFYGGDAASARYSPLALIDRDNVANLEIAWFWETADTPLIAKDDKLRSLGFQATPIFEGGMLYTSTALSQLAAIDPETGATRWVFDPGSWREGRPPNWGFVHRGVAFWRDGDEKRIFLGTGSGDLISIDARTGEVDPAFGDAGRVSIRDGLPRLTNPRQVGVSSPPAIYRNVVIVGSSISDGATRTTMPPGEVRGYDARTGEPLWKFETILGADRPSAGDPGASGPELQADTNWLDGSASYTGNTNVWAPMSVDLELGRVYLPVSTPTNDWYGGHRLGDNRFAESLVCLDALSGELVWHFQIVHHGLWDYDLPAAPILVDIPIGRDDDGATRTLPAVVQITKQGFAFVFDRVTGEPVWTIEERPVPQSEIPGEESSPTQPFPTQPPPYERQGVTVDDLIDFTPELRQEAAEIFRRYKSGPLYSPATLQLNDGLKGTLQLPGSSGGANWGGGAFDPETGWLYIPSITSPISAGLVEPDPARSDFRYVRMGERRIPGPQGLPLLKPPWGRITAIDLTRGEIVFQVPNGDGPRDHPAIAHLDLGPLGQVGRAGPLLTKTLLFVADGTSQTNSAGRWGGGRGFRAYDKATGEVLAEIELPGEASGVPMTYLYRGRQTIVVAVSGPDVPHGLVALRLQEEGVSE